jgi:hypothetical protein
LRVCKKTAIALPARYTALAAATIPIRWYRRSTKVQCTVLWASVPLRLFECDRTVVYSFFYWSPKFPGSWNPTFRYMCFFHARTQAVLIIFVAIEPILWPILWDESGQKYINTKVHSFFHLWAAP